MLISPVCIQCSNVKYTMCNFCLLRASMSGKTVQSAKIAVIDARVEEHCRERCGLIKYSCSTCSCLLVSTHGSRQEQEFVPTRAQCKQVEVHRRAELVPELFYPEPWLCSSVFWQCVTFWSGPRHVKKSTAALPQLLCCFMTPAVQRHWLRHSCIQMPTYTEVSFHVLRSAHWPGIQTNKQKLQSLKLSIIFFYL